MTDTHGTAAPLAESAPTLPIGSQRGLFDIPADVAYFNTAYNAPQLNESRERLIAAAAAKSRPWERTADDFFADAEEIRRLCSGLFGGDAEGYAVIPAASYGVSTAARAIEPTLGAGDRIIVLDEEFPSNVLPWRRAARETGARVVTVPTPEDFDWTSAALREIERGAKVVAVFHAHWTNGAVLDLERIGNACRAVGATLVIDATQSLGAMELDLAAVQPDFVVAAGYKWLLCPYGFGVMYVAPAWRDARPLEEHWLGREGASNFAALVNYVDTYRPGARRFDVGETCTPALPGAIAALEQLGAWGIRAITPTLAEINRRLAERLTALGFRLPPEHFRSPHMFGARVPDGSNAGDLVGALRKRHVFVSQRGSSLRFGPHLHVTDADIGRLSDTLEQVLPR
ncbi:MAG TPA: aminotransferase class V-fold PLP-dependent enzyme [Gemmatimonadaceae bacterium]|nr:aminotransferase class V-fold PLP-dependent enzyme [Gemmatimonadaceae bacterium]